MPYLFDGYNVYHAARKLSEEWAHITVSSMCLLVGEDMRIVRDCAIVAFDGHRPKGRIEQDQLPGCIKILYSGSKSDADSLIEQLIKENTAPKRLVVVSSDRRIIKAARRRRAKSLGSAEYLFEMLKRHDRPPAKPKEPWEKQHGVPEGQLRGWLEMFGIDPDEKNDDSWFDI